jgi:asparagine synthase (glutamine-hydrolysing)
MCRIVGCWQLSQSAPNISVRAESAALIKKMSDSLQHGGPDGGGVFVSEKTGLSLGHRRLSIVDLSANGAQPMAWQQWQIVFNGEIYNFREIRTELEQAGIAFSTQTDTEILLKGFELWGMEALLARCRGMFAFALWDENKQELYLVRDRMGVKPLFVYRKADLLLFASEIKPFHQHPQFDKTISPLALSLYLQYGYIPQPHCIFAQVQKVEAGTYWHIDSGGKTNIHRYWNAETAYNEPLDLPKSAQARQDLVEAQLLESFQLRMVADVEVGAFLSGGIDSSLVVAMLQKNTNRALQTFTMGFDDPAYNEAEHAKRIAQHVGSNHHEIYCSEADFLAVVPKLSDLYDEPFGDSSAVPTHLIAQLAKQSVKVSLSADGGDELFGGYTKYEATQKYAQKYARYPKWLRHTSAGLLSMFSPQWLERNSRFIPVLGRYKNLNHKVPKLVEALRATSIPDFFQKASAYAQSEQLQQLIRPDAYAAAALYQPDFAPEPSRLVGFLGLCDMRTYLEGDIMTKVDRATMHCALEGREPFLDHKIVELALSLDDQQKINNGTTKDILRRILYKYVPQELIDRPKQGFAVPIEKWLRGVLSQQLTELSHDSQFFAALPLQSAAVKTLIEQFLSQKKWVNPHLIWFIYVLWQWQRRWLA